MLTQTRFSLDASTIPETVNYDQLAAGDTQTLVTIVGGFAATDAFTDAEFVAKVNVDDADDDPNTIILYAAAGDVDDPEIGAITQLTPRAYQVAFQLTAAQTRVLLAARTYSIRAIVERGGTTYQRVIQCGQIGAQQLVGTGLTVYELEAAALTEPIAALLAAGALVFIASPALTTGAQALAASGAVEFNAPAAALTETRVLAVTPAQTFIGSNGALTEAAPALAATPVQQFIADADDTRRAGVAMITGPRALAVAGDNGLPINWSATDLLKPLGPASLVLTGPSGRTYHDTNGVLQNPGTNVSRLANYSQTSTGLWVENWLLEGSSRTNVYPISEPGVADLTAPTAGVTDNAIFSAYGFSKGVHVAGSTGITEIVRVSVPGLAATTTYAFGVYVLMDDLGVPKAGTSGDATADMMLVISSAIVSSGWVVRRLGTTPLYRISGVATTSGSPTAVVAVERSTSHTQRGFSVVGLQCEAAAASSSYIKTTGTSVTIAGETAYVPLSLPPITSTYYAKFVERGLCVNGVANARVLNAGDSVSTAQMQIKMGGANKYQTSLFRSDGTSVTSNAASSPVVGDEVELRVELTIDGSGNATVQTYQSINGAAEVAGGLSSVLATMDAAWSNQRLYVGGASGGAAGGLIGLEAVKVARGIQSLTFLRAA